jgi:hypothetical protein
VKGSNSVVTSWPTCITGPRIGLIDFLPVWRWPISSLQIECLRHVKHEQTNELAAKLMIE